MKKLSISIALTFSTMAALAGGSLSQQSSESVSNGQTVMSRSLDGNKLTMSVCEVSMTAEGTYSRCVSETQKLTPKEVALMRDSIRFEQQALLSSRSASRSVSFSSKELSGMQSQSSSATASKAITQVGMTMSGSAGVSRSLKNSAR